MKRFFPLLLILVTLLTGCGQSLLPANNAATPVLAFSEAVVGRNRIALGLIRDGSPLNDPAAQVTMRFVNLDQTSPQPGPEMPAAYYGQGLPIGYYVTYTTFDQPGNWSVEVKTKLPDQSAPSTMKLRLDVKAQSEAPSVGQPAKPTKTLTVRDVPDAKQLSSGATVDPAMYQISLDAALTSGKPTALLFATPGFCKTATCSPSLQVMEGLQKTYGDRMNFIHVEVYKYPFAESFQAQNKIIQQATQANRQLTPEEARTGLSDAMIAWDLPSEPWLFLIDAKGIIAARYEGGLTKEELGPALNKLIAGQSPQ